MADQIKLKSVALNHNFYNRSRTCTRHPSHRQSPGVCSLCVNEKLARLSMPKSPLLLLGASSSVSSSSSLSEVSSCSSSECISPSEVRAKYASKRGSYSFVKRPQKEDDDVVLSKSRSMAAAFVKEKKSGVGGFWSKMLKRTRRN